MMTPRLAKLIFYIGTFVSLALFLALTYDTDRQFAALTHADRLNAQVIAGKHAFERHNCNDCHTILGFGAYYAPDLTRAYMRIGDEGIWHRLEKPEVTFASSFRKMPQQRLTQAEIADIVAYLQWVSHIENHDWPPQDSIARWKASTDRLLAGATMSAGAALIQQEGCLACHELGDQGDSTGPRMEWIGARHDAMWIADYIADPQKYSPGSKMDPFKDLSRGQREMIGEFIVAAAAGQGR